MDATPARCDLHVHSRYSTDSGNYALRRARMGESFTEPGRVYSVCRRRGMTLVTITDHNTLEGALRIAELPGTFLSVEVTTCFPDDDLPLHVLVWNLSEEDHRDLQPYRRSVYELVAFLRSRGVVHALAHPLYRMGKPLTASHVERMLLLFGIWEARNGARPEESNELACRLARSATPAYLEKLAERHGFEPAHSGAIALTGGSDDHGAFDIATTWTDAAGSGPVEFLGEVAAGNCLPCGAHGSTLKLAHAVGGLFLRAYRAGGGHLPAAIAPELERLLDEDADEAYERHSEIAASAARLASVLAERARSGGLGFEAVPGLGPRAGALALAGALQAPYLATAGHHAGSRAGLRQIERAFFGPGRAHTEPRALVFTDTLEEVNGVAGTMRRLAAAGAEGRLPLAVVAARGTGRDGVLALEAEWTFPLPGYESIELRFPSPTDVLARLEEERPDLVHVATPGPVGLCGLLTARLLGVPVLGSYHTLLGPYALQLTRDLLVAEAFDWYVHWFYRQCTSVLAPTHAVAAALEERGLARRVGVWGRGVDADLFSPSRRSTRFRRTLLAGGELLLLSVGRLSPEKGPNLLLEAFALLRNELPGLRLAFVGDGPARPSLEAQAPKGVHFLGELRGEELARVYASADVFCFPSTTDTFGQVLLEASASGLPVVAADTGGAREIVRDGVTGILVRPEDPRSFAAALGSLAGSGAVRSSLGTAGRASALERSWERSYTELLDAYRAIAGLSADPVRVPVAV